MRLLHGFSKLSRTYIEIVGLGLIYNLDKKKEKEIHEKIR